MEINLVSDSPAKPVKPDTLLSQLRAKVQKDLTRPDIFIDVPEREGVKLLLSPNVDREQHKEALKANTNKKGDVNTVKFAARLLAEQTRGIFINDQEVFDEDGNSLTFASDTMKEMTDTLVPVPDTVVAFFGKEHIVEAAAAALLTASGIGDDVEVEEAPLD